MLSDMIGKSNILLGQSPSDWTRAIAAAAQPLLTARCIEPRYVDGMIASVKKFGAYIVIAKGVALAHARSEDGVRSLGLSVMTLKEPVDFGSSENDPVKIVFCLAAPDATAHLDLMRALVRIIDEDWKIADLASADTVERFIGTLNRLEAI